MVQSNVNNAVQAVPLIEGKINLTMADTQPNPVRVNSIIHCEEDGTIRIDFAGSDVDYTMTAGMDRALSADVFILSGTFTTD